MDVVAAERRVRASVMLFAGLSSRELAEGKWDLAEEGVVLRHMQYSLKKKLEVIPDIVDVSLGIPVVVGVGEITHHRYEVVGYGGYLFGCVGDVCGIGKVNT